MKALPEALRRRLDDGGSGLAVLILRLGALGDILRTLPPVRLLRQALPGARILWAVDDRWEPVLRAHPALDGTVPLPRREIRDAGRSPAQWGRLLEILLDWGSGLRRRRFALALDFHGNLRSAVAGILSGADVRVGYGGHQQKEGNRLFTTHRVPSGARRVSRMERNLSLVSALGIPVKPLPDGGLPARRGPARVAGEIAARCFGDGRPFAVLSPGASARQAYKRPPVPLLVAAVARLAEQGLGCLVVFGPGEEEDALRCAEASGSAASIAPPTDLDTLAALLRRARMFISGDTGPLHLACAVGCPVLGIYGPTDPVVNAPWGVAHETVYPPARVYTGIKRRDREGGGFEGVTEEAIAAAIDRLADARTSAEIPG